MPTNFIGEKANLQIKDNGGVLRDISAYLTQADRDVPQDALDTTTFGSVNRTFIPGLQNQTFTLAGLYDQTFVGYIDNLMIYQGTATALQTFQWGPQGTATGAPKYTGSYFITDYKVSAPVAGVSTVSLNLQVSGAGTVATF